MEFIGFSVWWWLFLALFIVSILLSRVMPKFAAIIAVMADVMGTIVLSNLYWGWSGRGGLEVFLGRLFCISRAVGLWGLIKDRQFKLLRATGAIFYGFIILADHFALMSLISGAIAVGSLYWVTYRAEEEV